MEKIKKGSRKDKVCRSDTEWFGSSEIVAARVGLVGVLALQVCGVPIGIMDTKLWQSQ